MHATKPATIGAALDDSPLALAAWIGEKLTRWSSTTAGGRSAFDRDLLLSTLTLYWATRTGASSLLPYWAHRHTPDSAFWLTTGRLHRPRRHLRWRDRPFPKPPRELAERYFNVVAWAEHGTGGDFPAVAEPQLLARRLRDVFQPYRNLPGSAGRAVPYVSNDDGTSNAYRP